MTTANIITLIRIALVPLFMWTMSSTGSAFDVISIVIFAIASLTDGIDGYIARKYNQVTNFGKFIDPLADKLLVTAALLIFVGRGVIPSWAAMLIIAREFFVTSLRIVAISEKNLVVAANFAGKIKMVVQIVCILFLLTNYTETVVFSSVTLGDTAVALMVVVTVWSGIVYFAKNRGMLNMRVKR